MKAAGTKSSVVIDGSVAIAWCFDEVYSKAARSVLNLGMCMVVPAIFPVEVANYFGGAVRRGVLTEAAVSESAALLGSNQIQIDITPLEATFQRLLPLMKEYGLTSYDASYLELAMRTGAALATLDAKLRAAGKACGVRIMPEI